MSRWVGPTLQSLNRILGTSFSSAPGSTGAGALALGTGPTTWTPADASGASLSFSSVTAYYYKVGKLVVATCRFTFPATANGTQNLIGGLPATAHNSSASILSASVITTAALPTASWIQANTTQFILINSQSGVGLTNAQLTGALVISTMVYFTD